jgi:hypothetical protein
MMTALDMQAVPPSSKFLLKLALAVGIVALGDWLLYRQEKGISLVLFLAILVAVAFVMRPKGVSRRDAWIGAIFFVVALLPLMESVGLISVLFGILGTALAAVVVTGGLSRGWDAIAASMQKLLLTGPFQIFPDMLRAGREARSQGRRWVRIEVLAGWIVPVLCGAIFIALFASANPLIEQWLSVFDITQQDWEIDGVRLFGWVVLIAIAWPYISMRLCEKPLISRSMVNVNLPRIDDGNRFFGSAIILRSLVLFNLLFAVQTILDAVYLWGGASLPEGMSYAAYAHRGAYPLIVTALLAAAFVLVAMRPGGAGEQSPIIRRLVYLWVGQNVLLVISSILRLELYVDVYSLTLLRVAAFIWMLLVAVGLTLIMARIALGRSNGWLVGANVLALALTLYICSFVNFAAVIANHNLSYRHETMPGAVKPDITYIRKLGPHVIPAVDRYIARHNLPAFDCLVDWRNRVAQSHTWIMSDWRGWSFRDWRLQHYLAASANAKKVSSATSECLNYP